MEFFLVTLRLGCTENRGNKDPGFIPTQGHELAHHVPALNRPSYETASRHVCFI
jgi:hypothetical protein